MIPVSYKDYTCSFRRIFSRLLADFEENTEEFMLQELRGHANHWSVKVLFVILIASFGIWGIGDVAYQWATNRPLATVGSQKIPTEMFLFRYRKAETTLRQNAKKSLTAEDIQKFGLHQQVLDQLVRESLLKQKASFMKLRAADQTVKEHVYDLPVLRNESGEFDRGRLSQVLDHMGLSESGFVAQVRQSLLEGQLLSAMALGARLPKAYGDFLVQALEGKRVFSCLFIPQKSMVLNAPLREAELKGHYDKNQQVFKRPEFRSFSYACLDRDKLAAALPLSEADLRADYERRQADFHVPEKRNVVQLSFRSERSAMLAYEAIKIGRPFKAAAREFDGKYNELGLIAVTHAPEIAAEAIFALEPGQPSEIIKTALGHDIYLVNEIEPARTQAFEEIKDVLEKELRAAQGEDQYASLRNKLEDAVAGGTPLKEIVAEYKMTLESLAESSVQGLNQKKQAVFKKDLSAAHQQLILKTVFAHEASENLLFVDAGDSTAFVIKVNTVVPSQVPPFADIQDEVKAHLTAEKQLKSAREMAEEVVKEIQNVKDLTQSGARRKFTVFASNPISRLEADRDAAFRSKFPVMMIPQLFSLKPGRALAGPVENGFAVVVVQKIIPFDLKANGDKVKVLASKLDTWVKGDVESFFLESLKKQYPVSISASELQRVTGGGEHSEPTNHEAPDSESQETPGS